MRAFVISVDRGSLASAAKSLGQSPATVSRGIAMLESRLHMRLMHRSTRALTLTPFGEAYLATCRDVLSALDAAERGAEAERETPSGVLTVTGPLRFGHLHLRPIVDAFLDANPAVRARLLLLDRVVSMADEGIDLGVRIAHLPDSSLAATRVGEVRRVLCAAPSYLEKHGAPDTPGALVDHDCIMERDGAETELWRFSGMPGRAVQSIAIRPRLVINSAAAAVDSAVAGHGITRVMSYQAAAAVASGELTVLLASYEQPPIPVHLVLPSARSQTAKQRAFVSFAAPRLKAVLRQVAVDMEQDRGGDEPPPRPRT